MERANEIVYPIRVPVASGRIVGLTLILYQGLCRLPFIVPEFSVACLHSSTYICRACIFSNMPKFTLLTFYRAYDYRADLCSPVPTFIVSAYAVSSIPVRRSQLDPSFGVEVFTHREEGRYCSVRQGLT